MAGLDGHLRALEVAGQRERLAPDRGAVRLTPRERIVLDHIARGATVDGIAARMAISPPHGPQAPGAPLRSLGAVDRLSAVLSAQRLGLISAPEPDRPPRRPPVPPARHVVVEGCLPGSRGPLGWTRRQGKRHTHQCVQQALSERQTRPDDLHRRSATAWACCCSSASTMTRTTGSVPDLQQHPSEPPSAASPSLHARRLQVASDSTRDLPRP